MHSLLALVMLTLLASCAQQSKPPSSERYASPDSSRTTVEPATPMVTSKKEYRLRKSDRGYEADISYTYTNRLGHAVYLLNCNGNVAPGIERREGSQWKSVWVPESNACLSPPVVIQPGATYRDSLTMTVAPYDSAFYAELGHADPTTPYRLIWHQALASFDAHAHPFGETLPAEQRSSNEFFFEAP